MYKVFLECFIHISLIFELQMLHKFFYLIIIFKNFRFYCLELTNFCINILLILLVNSKSESKTIFKRIYIKCKISWLIYSDEFSKTKIEISKALEVL